RDVVVNQGRVASLRAFRRDGPRLRFAPVANSSDGLGGALDPSQPKWPPFGTATLPPAPVGFAVASPVLRMSEGDRAAEVSRELPPSAPARLTDETRGKPFQAFLTGPKDGSRPKPVSARLAGGTLILGVTVDATSPAVVDYAPAVHTQPFAARAPVLQF